VRVCYFGTYDRHHCRNQILQRGLALAGGDVLECCAEPGEANGRLADLYRRMPDHDVVLVGHPGFTDIRLARELAGGRPVVLDAALSPADPSSENDAYQAADLILLGTEAQIEHASQALAIPRPRFARVFVGADDRLFRPPAADLEQRGDTRRVLFHGDFVPAQGVEHILRAAALLAPEPHLRFTLIGTGPLYEPARALADELELSNVDWVEHVPYEALPAQIAAADVCLGALAPRGEALRTIPDSIFQALACGARVITADTPAIRELPPVGHALTRVPPGDPEALAAAIRSVCEIRTLLVREPGTAEFLPERMGRELLMRLALAKALQ
jgi:glycosyltransferase involved in cell wall biosynthesis